MGRLRTLKLIVARGEGRVEAAAIGLAVALAVYLPVEPLILADLSGAPYWFMRLLPDALVAVVAAAVILTRGERRRAGLVILWTLVAVSSAVVLVDLARGFGPGTTINSLRVLLRYAVLGASLFAVVREPSKLLRWLGWALVIGVVVQFAAAFVQVAGLAEPMATGARSWSLAGLLGVGGTVGRYDRLGLLMVAGVLLAVVGAVPGPRSVGRIVLVLGVAGLVISSSRQAQLGLIAAAAMLALLPRIAVSVRVSRLAIVGITLLLLVLLPVPVTPRQASDPDAPSPVSYTPVQTGPRSSTKLTLDPNRNFRLYYTLKLLPWAAMQEPLLGFGPGEQTSKTADARLQNKVRHDGMPWSWAINFMNDSNYGSMIIQYGMFLPAAFMLFIGSLAFVLLRRMWRGADDPWLAFALGYTAVCFVGAAFGPAFEIRTVSVFLWLGLFGGLLILSPPLAGRAVDPRARPDGGGLV